MKMINLNLLAVLLAATGAFAQNDSPARVLNYATAVRMPGTASRVDDSNFLKPEYINNINVSAVRDFVKRFHDQDNARWFKLKDASLIVKFDRPDVGFRVAYSSKGSWVYTLQTYHEKQMPRDVRATVKSTYYDYSITQVEEIDHTDGAGIVYIVHVKDDASWKTLRVCNGEMDVLETLYKK